MGIQTFTPASPIKSIQRGTTASAGTVTISSINTAKAFIRSASKGSAGTVAATGTIASTSLSGSVSFSSGTGLTSGSGQNGSISGTVAATSISGGTTNLTSKVYSAVITNATTITCDGPVEWEVVEYA
jgi:hypothetical protein